MAYSKTMTEPAEKKLFLLDAYALIYRAYYAFIANPRINSKGQNTSAIFGFTNTLIEILNKEKPTHIAVVFDPPKEKIRTAIFPEYKANREATPEDIKMSIPYVKRVIEGFRIPVLMVDGYEADDVIGTLSHQAKELGFVTYMMTPDKDYGQLVGDNVFMYKPSRSGNGAEVWGAKEVCEKFGIAHPWQVIDMLGLMGDKVDNIPGIPGIGQKTAAKLLKEFDTMENILDNTDKLKGKQKENVETFAEQGKLSKLLATIILDVPITLDEDALVVEEIDKELLREVLSELEFRTLAKRLLNEDIQVAEPMPSNGQMSMFGNSEPSPQSTKKEAEKEAEPEEFQELKSIKDVEHDYILVDSAEDLQKLLAILSKAKEFSFDTETSGLDAIQAEIVGMSFSIKAHAAWYVPVLGNHENKMSILQIFKPLLEDPNKKLIAQNFKYDYKVMRKYGIDIASSVFDTMIAHYLINPDMKHNMNVLSETYLHYQPVSIETLIGKKGKDQGSMAELAPEEIVEYAGEDADVTLQLKETFEPELKSAGLEKLFDTIEIPLIRVLADMELEGISLDSDHLIAFSSELEKEINVLEEEIIELAGIKFNIDSPKQLGPVIYDKLNIGGKIKKTKSGQSSTSEDILSKLVDEHPIIQKILDYRQLKKLKSTYVDPLPELTNPVTGRIHTSFMQTVAATGRLSSNNPNLQNIPIRTEKGREIRKAFIPRSEEFTLLSADYSQVELRIIAAMSGDKHMIEAFQQGEDIHAATAARVFGVPLAEVDRDMRSKAKAVNFGIIYGQSAFGLAQNLNISRTEAKDIIDQYFNEYSGIKDYISSSVEFAKKNGYVETVMGRRRYLKDINSNNAIVRGFAERNAINAPIQGSAADIIKKAMIDIHQEMKSKSMKSKMILQVHDELVFDTHLSELEELKKMVTDKMQNAFKISVPLKVDVGVGANWLEAH